MSLEQNLIDAHDRQNVLDTAAASKHDLSDILKGIRALTGKGHLTSSLMFLVILSDVSFLILDKINVQPFSIHRLEMIDIVQFVCSLIAVIVASFVALWEYRTIMELRRMEELTKHSLGAVEQIQAELVKAMHPVNPHFARFIRETQANAPMTEPQTNLHRKMQSGGLPRSG